MVLHEHMELQLPNYVAINDPEASRNQIKFYNNNVAMVLHVQWLIISEISVWLI